MNENKSDSFSSRLKAAERRSGLKTDEEEKKDAEDKDGQSLSALALRVGTEMISALIVGVCIGWGLDKWLHTRAIFLIIFALLGGGAGVVNVWRLVKPPPV